MATLEQEKSFGERNGERARNIGLAAILLGLLPVPTLHVLLGPGVVAAAGGEVWRRVSKPKQR